MTYRERAARVARPRRLAPALAILMVLAGASSASAATKDYSVTIAPPSVPPGVVVDMTATFANQTRTQELGSANLTAPAGFTLEAVDPLPAPATATIVNGVLELRDLALQPQASLTVGLSVTTGCATGTVAWPKWQVDAKQSNSFQGLPGNGLRLDPSSALTTTTVGGCVPCPEDVSEGCSTAFPQHGSSLNVRADADPNQPDAGKLTMRPLTSGQVDCAGWSEYAAGYQYDAPENRAQVFTLTFPGTNARDPLDVCFGSVDPFAVKTNTTATEEFVDGVHLFVGRLPNCIGLSPGPCVTSRDSKARSITARKGPGDPYPR